MAVIASRACLQDAMTDESRFRRGAENWRAFHAGEVDPNHALVSMVNQETLLTVNGQDHRRARNILQATFTPRRVEQLRPRVEELTNELLAAMADAGGAVDLKAALARPLPIRVISELLGVSRGDMPMLEEIATKAFGGGGGAEVDEDGVPWNEQALAYIQDLITHKRNHPGDDLVTALIDAHDGQRRLSDEEVLGNILLLIVAGFETTMGAIANTARALLEHPVELARVTTGEVSWTDAIAESMRYDPSVAMLPMLFTARETTLGGIQLAAGEPLLMHFMAANWDPEVYGTTADRFDLTRTGPTHMGFGHGVHYCLGAPLARLELGVVLPALFDRFGDIALAQDPPVAAHPSVFMNHPQHLWVRTAG